MSHNGGENLVSRNTPTPLYNKHGSTFAHIDYRDVGWSHSWNFPG